MVRVKIGSKEYVFCTIHRAMCVRFLMLRRAGVKRGKARRIAEREEVERWGIK